MSAPRPESARFVGRSANARAPAPPFGLERWSPDGVATVVELDASDGDFSGAERTGAVARQVPDCGGLPPRTLVVLLGVATRGGGIWRRLVRMNTVSVSRAARCSALLVRGYVDIGAAPDAATSQDLVWGWSP
jgi:hypothetical protein